jgi:hypothetical protein
MRRSGALVSTLAVAVGCGGQAAGPLATFDAGDAEMALDAGEAGMPMEDVAGASNDDTAPETAEPEADASPPLDASGPEPEAAATDPATWSHIYNTLLDNMSYASNCTGEGCHDPGTQMGLDLSTPVRGYASVQAKLVPGDPEHSTIVMKLESGEMPRTRPAMPAADLALIKAWIAAGAPND